MSVVNWDKPKKVISKEKWKGYGFDGGPVGGYVSNMSREDYESWRGKITYVNTGFPQAELRNNGMVLIVNLGTGYKYKHDNVRKPDGDCDTHVRWSSSGPQFFSFQDWEVMNMAVAEAVEKLKEITNDKEKV